MQRIGLPIASSPQVAVKFLMMTLEQESGSIPSVLGEVMGAEKTTFSINMLSQTYGWMAQNGGSTTIMSVMVRPEQYMGSISRGLPLLYMLPSSAASHQACPWPLIRPCPEIVTFLIPSPPMKGPYRASYILSRDKKLCKHSALQNNEKPTGSGG